jgi:tetratricopeptide (TPR) repeat protein
MGYGEKSDLNTGRKLNLDKTFEHLIQPVFEELGITCIRASDVKHGGIIDVPMYDYILKSDIVVADLSTLNANAIYELGVRHGVRPYTTLVIAEDQLKYPFDLNHISITTYQHLGVDIGASEVKRFKTKFKALVSSVLEKAFIDSPVYTYLKGLKPPEFTEEEKEQIIEAAEGSSISDLITEGESHKDARRYKEALEIFRRAHEFVPNEPFILQRLALLTYKLGLPSPISALIGAEKILESLNPTTTNDVETLGLLGAINKRLYENTKDITFLRKAISYYERGFINGKDYYNGVNLAYLYLLNSSLTEDNNERIADLVNSKRIRTRTYEICKRLIATPSFFEMTDKIWILFTLAEITGINEILDDTHEIETSSEEFISQAIAHGASEFQVSSFREQQRKIIDLIIQSKN